VRGLTLTLGLAALMSIGVVLGFAALNVLRTEAEDSALPPLVDAPAAPAVDTHAGLPVAPEPQRTTVLMRVYAPRGRCWSATSAGRPLRDGCGSVEFPLEVEGFVLVHFERLQSGAGQLTAMIEVDGRTVQTVGPTTSRYPSFDIGYRVPESG
jgi:hypothetical protein